MGRPGRVLIAIFAMLFVCIAAYSQVDTTSVVLPADPSASTIPSIAGWFTQGIGPVMSALVLIFGYLSKWIPWVKMQDTTLRVFAFAVLLAAGYFFYGGDIVEVAISYMTATSLYEVILKKLFPSKKPETDGNLDEG